MVISSPALLNSEKKILLWFSKSTVEVNSISVTKYR